MKNKLIVDITSALLILLLIYAAVSKLLDLHAYIQVLKRMPVLQFAPRFFSIAIPTVEILVAVLLFVPRWRRYGLKGSFILLCAFTLYLLLMLVTMPTLPCSCGGMLNQLSWKQHVVFNVCFIIVNAVAMMMARKNMLQHAKPARSAGQEES